MRRVTTRTKNFGVGRREAHDSSMFYARSLMRVTETKDKDVAEAPMTKEVFRHSAESMVELPDNSVSHSNFAAPPR
jgi:hypothetical protein